ncbi:MAG: hypothetical protein Q7V53_02870 [Caldisericota bacterium]|nr:hypothetical protein [Caldisericota bacterium]
MADAQANPLALPGVQEAIEAAVVEFDQKETVRVQAEVADIQKRETDLRRIHRRAARRSEAKGNPIALRRTTISDRLDVMISEGVTADTSRELALEAGRRVAMATAVSGWLQERSKQMTTTLKRLTPYFMEKGEVALAQSKRAIDYVSELGKGIASLKLYTGEGVDVAPVREGEHAPTHEPLTIFQGKRFMDEELAVWADVGEGFDWTDQSAFFKALREDDRLRDQVLPAARCVVSMAVTRRRIEYGRDVDPFTKLMNEMANKRVFLLVRNGENVCAVYSSEPSHEAAWRLFPTRDDITSPFVGRDGTQIGLTDVAFGKASQRFEDQALHYLRFLILLCGLDHRERLFGEFYPPERAMSFMSKGFQSSYMRFIEDDDDGLALAQDNAVSVDEWIVAHNRNLRSGSRVVVGRSEGLHQACPSVKRQYNLKFSDNAKWTAHVVQTKSKHLCIGVATVDNRATGTAIAWLTGPTAPKMDDWFLCVDQVQIHEVHRYIHSRRNRAGSIAWLRTLRRVQFILEADLVAEKDLRSHLRSVAVEAGVLAESELDSAVSHAIGVWRADHRGAAAPTLDDKRGVSALLTLLYPADVVAGSMRPLAEAYAKDQGLVPLKLTRDGKSRLCLYVEVPEAERAQYGSGLIWGWVRRMVISFKNDRISVTSSSQVWLQAGIVDASEIELHAWAELDQWLNPRAAPCTLAALVEWNSRVAITTEMIASWGAQVNGRGTELPDEIYRAITKEMAILQEHTYFSSAWVSLPVGMYQMTRESPVMRVFMTAAAVPLVFTHGSAEQKADVRRFMHRSRGGRNTGESLKWSVYVCSEHVKGYTTRLGLVDPKWATIESHRRGGTKSKSRQGTRAERRAAGGQPYHSSETVKLSHNRAFDSLMEVAPLKRRAFYKSLKNRVSWIFGVSDDSVPERRKQEKLKRYAGRPPLAVDLSPVVWDAKLGRSLANRYFSGKRTNTTTPV